MLRDGLSNPEIATRLGISREGAKYHVSEILGKLGVDSREAAAAWQPSERRPRWLAAVTPMSWAGRKLRLSWLPSATAGAIAIFVAAGAGLLVWGLVRTGGDGGAAQPARPPSGLIVAINEAPAPVVSVLDARTGRVLGEVPAGDRPWVLLRPSERQLLVSQMSGSGAVDGPSLRIFDLDKLAAPAIKEIPMPRRSVGHIYAPNLALSGNERFVFCSTVRSICPEGGDTRSCDIGSVVVIDLDSGEEIARTDMPLGRCNVPGVTSVGEQDVWAMCGTVLRKIGPDGEVKDEIPSAESNYAGVGVDRDGAAYVLYRNGRVWREKGEATRMDLLPDATSWVGWQTFALIGQDRAMFLFSERSASNHPYEDLAVFEVGNPEYSESFRLPHRALQVAAVDDDTVALLAEDGTRLSLFSLTDREVVGEIEVPAGARWIVGG